MNYQQEEKKLCIADYVWRILFHWRRMVVFMVLFSILACGMKYVKDIQVLQNQKKAAENKSFTVEDIEKKINQIPEVDRANTATVFNLIKALKNKDSYARKAAVMRLDAYDVDRIVLQYHIETDTYISELLKAYSRACFTEEAISEIIDSSENTYTTNDVVDMISFSNGGTIKIGNKNSDAIAIRDNSSTLNITIRGENQGIAEQIAKSVKIILERYKAQAEKIYGFHSLVLVSESYENGKDNDIVDIQNSFNESVYYTVDRINNIKRNSLGEEAVGIVEEYTAAITTQESKENSGKNILETDDNTIDISISKKWLFLGAILGFIFECGLEFLYWIGSGKLNSADELQQNFSTGILGVVEDKKEKKAFGVIDVFIYKLKNRHKKCLDSEQMFRMILSKIIINANKKGIQNIYVTGTEIERQGAQVFLKKLKQETEKSGINLIIGQSINSDVGAFSEVASIGNTILVEETNMSIFREIIKELQICEEQGVNIFGSIVIEH